MGHLFAKVEKAALLPEAFQKALGEGVGSEDRKWSWWLHWEMSSRGARGQTSQACLQQTGGGSPVRRHTEGHWHTR